MEVNVDSCALCEESRDLEDYTVYTGFLVGLADRTAGRKTKRTANYSHLQSHVYRVCGRCRGRARTTLVRFTAFTVALYLGFVALLIYFVNSQLVLPALLVLFLSIGASIGSFLIYDLLVKRSRVEERLVEKAVASRGKRGFMPATGFTESQYKRLKTTAQ